MRVGYDLDGDYAPGPVLPELRVTAHIVDITVWDSDPKAPPPGPPIPTGSASTVWRS
jgi:hypothetical protein